jgi:catechol 2,3-dioxygenase-like lactoylglutathione lyase family enzyme
VGIDDIHLHVPDARFYREAWGAAEASRAGAELIFLRLPGGAGVIAVDGRAYAADPDGNVFEL